MAYQCHNFCNGQVLTAEILNEMEKGIVAAEEKSTISGKGAPTGATVGAVGKMYMDSDTGDMYKCTAAEDGVYTWQKIENGPGETPDMTGYATEQWVEQGYQPKGDYALRSELPEAVNDALEQAKESGEFDGYTPQKYIDYFTEADKVEMVTAVMEAIGCPVFGLVDENNNIVLSGTLPDGTYSVKYEMENGSTINIGNMVLDTNVYYSVTNTLTNCTTNNSATKAVQGGSYSATITANSGYTLKSVSATMGGQAVAVSGGNINIANVTGNIVITAVAEAVSNNALENAINADGTPYIGTNGEKGYKTGIRISGSSGGESTQAGCMATGFISAKSGQIVVIENMTLHSTANYNVLVLYDEKFAKLINTQIAVGNSGISNPASGVYEIRIDAFASASQVRYIRFSCADLSQARITYRNE